MRVFVSFQGKTILCSVEDNSVASLKASISRELGIPLETQQLFFAEAPVKEGQLSDYGIADECCLTLLQRVDSTLMCPKCATLFDADHHLPKFLIPCCHSFCTECLQEIKGVCPIEGTPIFGAETHPESCPIDFKSLDSIGNAVKLCEVCKSGHEATCYCPECKKYLCSKKGELHAEGHECEMVPILKETDKLPQYSARMRCLKHVDEDVVYFDQTAGRLACVKCVPELDGHKFILLSAAELKPKFEEWQEAFRVQIEDCRKSVDEFVALERSIEDHKVKLERDFVQQRDRIDGIFEHLQRKLMERKDQVVKELESCHEMATAETVMNARAAERLRENLTSLIEQHGRQEPPAVLNSMAIVEKELKISSGARSWLSNAVTKPSVKAEVDVAQAEAAIANFGQVLLFLKNEANFISLHSGID